MRKFRVADGLEDAVDVKHLNSVYYETGVTHDSVIKLMLGHFVDPVEIVLAIRTSSDGFITKKTSFLV